MQPYIIRRIAILICLFFWLAIISSCIKANAHDPQHPELDSWYRGLNAGNVPCCDGSDAKHLSDIEWRTQNGHYQVFIENQWVNVPPQAVIQQPNRDGRALVWPTYKDGKPTVRCFMPGLMS